MAALPARPVLLLHGCGGTAASAFVAPGWPDAMAHTGRPAVVVDLPGHGRAGVSTIPADYADLAGMLMPCLPAGPFDAVGFSLGAKLLLELALRLPARVGRIVLGGIGDNVFAPEAIAEAAARALESGPAADTPPAVRAFLETWEPACNNALAVAAVLRRPPNPVFTPEALRQVTAPALVVNGALDPIGGSCDRLKAALPGARFLALPGIGHFELTQQPAFIREAIAFLLAGNARQHAVSRA